MEVELEIQFEISAYPDCIACYTEAEHDHEEATHMHA